MHGLGVLGTAFWIWAIYDCYQNEPERDTWLWILLIGNVAGAVLYVLLRRLPNLERYPAFLRRWTWRHELWQAESAARNIGGAHQFVELGNILRDMRIWVRAGDAYRAALEKDSNNADALWGASQVDLHEQNFKSARSRLDSLVKLDPSYKFGEAQLCLSRSLFFLQVYDAAEAQLRQYLKQWNEPEAHYLFAELLMKRGEVCEARNHLERLVDNVKGSPRFHYRRNRRWLRLALRLLRELKPTPPETATSS
jgi:hypothetical protein